MAYRPEEIEELQYIGLTQSTSNVHRARELDYNQKIIVSGTVPTDRDPEGNIIIKSDTYEADPSQMLGANLFQRNYDNSELKKAVDTEIRELDIPTTEDLIDKFFKLFNDVKDDLSRSELGIVSGSVENQLGIDLVNREELEEAQNRISDLEQRITEREQRANDLAGAVEQLIGRIEAKEQQQSSLTDTIETLRGQINNTERRLAQQLNSLSSLADQADRIKDSARDLNESVNSHIRDKESSEQEDEESTLERILNKLEKLFDLEQNESIRDLFERLDSMGIISTDDDSGGGSGNGGGDGEGDGSGAVDPPEDIGPPQESDPGP